MAEKADAAAAATTTLTDSIQSYNTTTSTNTSSSSTNMADEEINWVGPASYRIGTIVCFVVLFPLGIPASAIINTALPALGLVPLAASALFSLILLRKQKSKKPKHSPIFIFFMDFLLSSSLLVVYLFTWFEVAERGLAHQVAEFAETISARIEIGKQL